MRPPYPRILLLSDSLRSLSSRIEIALHLRIKSSMSMRVGHKLALYPLTTLCIALGVLLTFDHSLGYTPLN